MASEMFDDTFIGTVLKINKATREVAVYIPKLMVSLYDGEATEYKIPTNNGLDITTSNNISSTVTKTNYIWAKPYIWTSALPKPGSKVFIIFLDKRPSQPKWWMCNLNGDYDVIDEEKYPKQASLTINDRTVPINLEDNITIDIPEYFRVTSEPSTLDDKIPTFHITENYNFYKSDDLQTSIINLQKSMQYLENVYNKTFDDAIDAITFSPTPSASITFPTEYSDIDGVSVFEEDKLDILKYHIIDKLNEIIENISIYPILYRREITNKINDTKHVLETVEDPTDTKYWQIVRQFYTWLEKYNFNLSGFLTNSFSKIQSKCKTQTKLSQNLLDSSEIYISYTKLLNGLKDTYTLYNTYISKYNLLSNSVKESLVDQHITEDIINNNIIVAFERAYDSVDINSIENYITYIKTLFPTQVTINYLYSDNGLVEENHYVETNKLFELNDNTVYTPEEEVLPIDTDTEYDATMVYDSAVYDWYTNDSDKLSIYNNYYLVKDITVKPEILFGAIVLEDELLKVYVYDTSENTLTYTYNGSASTLENINTVLNDFSNTTHTITINNTKTTITLEYSTANMIDNITNILNTDYDALSYEEFEDHRKLYDNTQPLYEKYLNYNQYITDKNIPTNSGYTTVVNKIKSAYGGNVSNIIRSYLGDLLTTPTQLIDASEHEEEIYHAYSLYVQYTPQSGSSAEITYANSVLPTLDLTNDEITRLNWLKDQAGIDV